MTTNYTDDSGREWHRHPTPVLRSDCQLYWYETELGRPGESNWRYVLCDEDETRAGAAESPNGLDGPRV